MKQAQKRPGALSPLSSETQATGRPLPLSPRNNRVVAQQSIKVYTWLSLSEMESKDHVRDVGKLRCPCYPEH